MIRNKKTSSLGRGSKRDRKSIEYINNSPNENDDITMTQEERADDVTWSPIDKGKKMAKKVISPDKSVNTNKTTLLGRARFSSKVQTKSQTLDEDKFDSLAAILNIIQEQAKSKDDSTKLSTRKLEVEIKDMNPNVDVVIDRSIKENVNILNITHESQSTCSMIDDDVPIRLISTQKEHNNSNNQSFDLIDELFNEEDFKMLENAPRVAAANNEKKSSKTDNNKNDSTQTAKNSLNPKPNKYQNQVEIDVQLNIVNNCQVAEIENVSSEELAMYDFLEQESIKYSSKRNSKQNEETKNQVDEIISAEESAMYEMMEQESVTAAKNSKRGRDDNNVNEVNKKTKISEVNNNSNHTSAIRCHRYLALEVTDDYNKKVKEIRCFSQGSNIDGSDWHKNIVKGFQTKVTTVLLTEEWYYSEIVGGDIFHVVELRDECVNLNSSDCLDGQKVLEGAMIVDNKNGLFVINPDILVTPTKISESCNCIRKGILSERIKSFDSSNSAAVLGTLRHEFMEAIMEKCMLRLRTFRDNKKNNKEMPLDSSMLVTPKEIQEISNNCIKNHIEELFCCDITDSQASEELKAVSSPIIEWVHKSFRNNTSGTSGNSESSASHSAVYNLTEMLASEESLWCPALGIKGCVDVMMNAKLQALPGSQSSYVGKNYLIPLELKTGLWRPGNLISHRAQVMLYILTLIIRERSPVQKEIKSDILQNFLPLPPRHGILLYIAPEKTVVEIVSPTWHDLRALIISRNKLALGLKKASELGQNRLPPMLRKPFDCEGCFHASTCMMYHAAQERGNAKTSGVATLFSYLLGKIKSQQLSYFRKWDRLIDLESNVLQSNYQDLWNLPGIVKEKNGDKCISNLRSLSCSSIQSENGKFCLILMRAERASEPIPKNLNINDRVILSLECAGLKPDRDIEDIGRESTWEVVSVEPAIAMGIISRITESEIHMELQECPNRLTELIISSTTTSGGWSLRVDRDDVNQITITTMRSNLMSFFMKPHRPKEFEQFKIKTRGAEGTGELLQEEDHIQHLRDLIIDMKAPIFLPISSLQDDELMFVPPSLSRNHYQQYRPALLALFESDEGVSAFSSFMQKGLHGEMNFLGGFTLYPGCNPIELFQEYRQLNIGQQECVRKVLLAQDYVLLLGLPGTGKTSTLSLVVRALIARGQTVMITSYTHSAVDNLLLKLLESNVSPSFIVRLGGTDPKTAECVLSKKSVSAISELRSKVTSARLIACTVLSAARHNLMSKFKIDWCIVDEAGQIAQPAVLGAIMRAKKFILVGDDCQLPPLVLSLQAATEGMDVSLLKRLSESHPEAISCLSIQYRMNEDIMLLCNSIVYEYKMLCGSPLIASAQLHLPNLQGVIQKLLTCQSNSWLVQCLQPQNSVIFLNTDNIRAVNVSEAINTHASSKNASINGVNLDEVNLIKSIFKCLMDCGADEKDIGIISPYRAQVEALNEELKDLMPSKDMSQLSNDNGDCCVGNCDISTVDKFQGRDKDIIILSTVRRMNDRSVGDLLRDWRRVNVALTRSRKKLIIIGSLQIMDRIPVLNKLRKLLLERNWVINMT